MDSVADQLIGLFADRFYSMLTSPLTSWLDYSLLMLLLSAMLGAYQLNWGLLGVQILRARVAS